MRSKFAEHFFYIFVLIIILTQISFNTLAAEAVDNTETASTKRVLFISSYHPGFHTFFPQVNGVMEALDDPYILIDYEYMDTKRFSDETNFENFYTSLTYKLDNLPAYDLVFVADDNGLDFIMSYKEELFPDTPIVFLGINDIESAVEAAEDPFVTGVVEKTSIKETIEMAYLLQPDATTVTAIVDGTTTGQADKESFYDEDNYVEGLIYEDLDASTVTFDELFEAISELGENHILILLSLFMDNTGTSLTFKESVKFMVESSQIPVYHPYESGVGDGLAGGMVISHYNQGYQAGLMALEILNGTSVSDIDPILESPNIYTYDMEVLEKFGLSAYVLPDDAVLLNNDPSFFEEYKMQILGISVLIFFESVIIILLVKANIARAVAEKNLKKSNEKLINVNEELRITNEEINITNHKLSTAYDEVNKQNMQIHDLIYIDELTGMNNRLAISQIIDKTLLETKDFINVLLFIDIDNFKNINDTFGHDVGDEIIKMTGDRLKSLENEFTSIGRFGGDEFIVLIKGFTDQSEIFDYLKSIKALFIEPLELSKKQFYLTISIGVVMHPIHGNTQSDLLKKADLALYKAKTSGKDKFIMFDDSMTETMEEKVEFQAALRKAFYKGELYLNYQPVIMKESHVVEGFEALIRWKSDEFGQVSSEKIIENAEEIGLIIEIGEFVIREACQFVKRMNEYSESTVRVGVNVSALQLIYDDFYQRINGIISELKCNPEMIVLELTESSVLESIEVSVRILEMLKSEGFEIALDDFGTGYSSLKYFRDLPLTILKIDQSFSKAMNLNSYNRKFVQMVVNIALEGKIKIIIEGIETLEELEVAEEIGCDMIQGYYFSRPINEEEAVEFLKQYNIVKNF